MSVVARDGTTSSIVIVRESGRSSIQETPAMKWIGRGVLDPRMRGDDGGGRGELLPVIARSVSDEASQLLASGGMECVACARNDDGFS
jgi:hypothetical protein